MARAPPPANAASGSHFRDNSGDRRPFRRHPARPRFQIAPLSSWRRRDLAETNSEVRKVIRPDFVTILQNSREIRRHRDTSLRRCAERKDLNARRSLRSHRSLLSTTAYAAQPVSKPQESYAPYWTSEPGWTAELAAEFTRAYRCRISWRRPSYHESHPRTSSGEP